MSTAPTPAVPQPKPLPAVTAPPYPSIRTDAAITPEQRAKLRKTKTVGVMVKNAVYGGNLGGIGPATQFHHDVQVYGLYEALLYVEGYERCTSSAPLYAPGTAYKAARAALNIKTHQTLSKKATNHEA